MILVAGGARVVDGQPHVQVHVPEHLGQVASLALERIGVQQHHGHTALGRTQEVGHQRRICAMQVQVGVPEADMHLQRPAGPGSLPEPEPEQDRVGQAHDARRLDGPQPGARPPSLTSASVGGVGSKSRPTR